MVVKNEEYNKKIIATFGSLLVIWISIIIISFLSPDMVTGSQQEHLKIVLWTSWIWGLLASIITLRMIREKFDYKTHLYLSYAIMIIWILVVILALLAPPFVTGSDPTKIPFGSIGAPFLGFIFTYAVLFLGRPPQS